MDVRRSLPPIALAALLVVAGATAAHAEAVFEVTVTNATRGQVITAPLVITHDENFELFQVGEPISSELAEVAQDGITAGFEALLPTLGSVHDFAVATEGFGPGASQTLEVETRGSHPYLTVTAMLATTNDAFIALSGMQLPRKGSAKTTVIAYDGGVEGNSELCEHIPGPPCDNPMVPNDAGAEGFAHVHAGIHGIGDLVPSSEDWRNPVAVIEIVRVQ